MAYLELRKERLIREAQQSYDSLNAELQVVSDLLQKAEADQKAFFDDKEMFLQFEKDKVEIAQWIELKSNLVEMRSNLGGLHERKRALQEMLAREEKDVVVSEMRQIDPVYSEIESQITSLEIQLDQARLRFTDDAPEVKDILGMLDALRDRIKDLPEFRTISKSIALNSSYEQLRLNLQSVEAEIEGLGETLAVRENEYAEMENQIKQIPTDMIALNRLMRDSTALEKRYNPLKERLDLAQISMATAQTAPPAMSVVDPARFPTKPIRPKKKFLFGGAILMGGFVGLTLSVLLNFFVGKVTENRLKLMHGYPVFAQLSHVGDKTKIRLNRSQLSGEPGS